MKEGNPLKTNFLGPQKRKLWGGGGIPSDWE